MYDAGDTKSLNIFLKKRGNDEGEKKSEKWGPI